MVKNKKKAATFDVAALFYSIIQRTD